MNSNGSFACSFCSTVFETSLDAEACCREEKISLMCSACGKTYVNKKQAIGCCQQVKEEFAEVGQ